MTSDFMKELLSKDEKITVEYKNCQYGIQEDVYLSLIHIFHW